ncbi:uncharacterized protein LOC111330736 isoform X2 [Stylophora pistillata]|uniref:uncharacterized protein LOC111330736 isoform X2 n=1 Tax=Stylophora pistillata TaxID=50429 RepID=UPI000C04B1B6|nr:uncharacterized protein LOC111330736 isoform X2 [Stylophora pistillata]
MADRSCVCDDRSKDPEHQLSQSPTLGEQGNPSSRESWLNGYAESNDGQPDDLAESIFSSQEEEEEHTTDVTAEELAFPPLATGIHAIFLARHTTDLSLLDQPPAGAATEAVLSFGVPNLSWNNVQDFRPNPPVEHYEGGGCSRGVLVDDDNIHGPISESCGGHLYLPACHSLGNLNSCCHCGEIHRNCYFIRIQRHMRTCPVCGQVF